MVPTTKAYRQFAAKEAGPFHEGTAEVTSTAAALIDTDAPVQSSIDQADLLKDKWLYLPAGAAADRLRVIKDYAPATGTLTPDKSWSVEPDGATYEVHGVVDPSKWTELINEGLKEIGIEVEFTVTPVSNATRHSLATQTWLTRDWQVRQVGYLASGEVRAEQNPFRRVLRGNVFRDGATLYLDHPHHIFNTTDTIYVKAVRLAYDFARPSAGAYGDQSGLSLETDEALPPTDLVGYAALCVVARRAFAPIHPEGRKLVAENGARWAALFSEKLAEFFTLPQLTFRPLRLAHFGRAWRR